MGQDVKVKTFLQALNLFPEELKRAKHYLDDKRLSQSEKTILAAWFLLRDGKNIEVIESIQKLMINDEIVELEKNLLLGIAYNNKAEFKQAKFFLEESIDKIAQFPLKRQTFLAYYNLFIVHYNLMDVGSMQLVFKELIRHKSGSKSDTRAILFCELCLQISTNNHSRVEKLFLDLDKLESETSESQVYSYQIIKFNYYIQNEQFEACVAALEKLKQFRKFQISANFKFMKTLLNFLTEDKTIYLYEQDFMTVPVLLWQVQVLKHLEASEVLEAKAAWARLSEIDPVHFKPEFNYQGAKNLFSLCLQKLRPSENKSVHIQGRTKEEKLLNILQNSLHPVRKEELYSLIWGEEVQNKDDYNKLKTMVMKIRQTTGIDIQSKKGCYLIVAAKKSAA
jgi:hypothetical protein